MKFNTLTEKATYPLSKTCNEFWASITLDTMEDKVVSDMVFDYVILIDSSGSMEEDNKMATLLATVQYIIENMKEQSLVNIIEFNNKVKNVTNGFEHKSMELINKLHTIVPNGGTNIGDAMMHALDLANKHRHANPERFVSILMFTDGIPTTGYSVYEISAMLAESVNDTFISFNTFGFGEDHDSDLLNSLSTINKGGGLYYYIKDTKEIAIKMTSSINGLNMMYASDIHLNINALSGCRIVNCYSGGYSVETEKLKKFSVNFGNMLKGEKKTFLMKLSLAKIKSDKPYTQPLIDFKISYYNTETRTKIKKNVSINIERIVEDKNEMIPIELDYQINTLCIATNIFNNINYMDNYTLNKNLNTIRNSPSAAMCASLIDDIDNCARDSSLGRVLTPYYNTNRGVGYIKYSKAYEDYTPETQKTIERYSASYQ